MPPWKVATRSPPLIRCCKRGFELLGQVALGVGILGEQYSKNDASRPALSGCHWTEFPANPVESSQRTQGIRFATALLPPPLPSVTEEPAPLRGASHVPVTAALACSMVCSSSVSSSVSSSSARSSSAASASSREAFIETASGQKPSPHDPNRSLFADPCCDGGLAEFVRTLFDGETKQSLFAG